MSNWMSMNQPRRSRTLWGANTSSVAVAHVAYPDCHHLFGMLWVRVVDAEKDAYSKRSARYPAAQIGADAVQWFHYFKYSSSCG